MNKYEKLKYICDTIGYDLKENGFEIVIGGIQIIEGGDIVKLSKCQLQQGGRDEREIIFHPEFMKFFIKYYLPEGYSSRQLKALYINIMLNLENPTDYLHKLIIGKQTQ